jgi:hypothetical protein
MKIYLQIAMVVLAACSGTWALFDASGEDSLTRMILFYPTFLGSVGGLLFSGHGGNHAVAMITALLINSVVWVGAWLVLRGLIRVMRMPSSN